MCKNVRKQIETFIVEEFPNATNMELTIHKNGIWKIDFEAEINGKKLLYEAGYALKNLNMDEREPNEHCRKIIDGYSAFIDFIGELSEPIE